MLYNEASDSVIQKKTKLEELKNSVEIIEALDPKLNEEEELSKKRNKHLKRFKILNSIFSKLIPCFAMEFFTSSICLLSLTEVIGGIFWIWLPWLGINEVPSTNTIIGGFFIFISIFYYSLIIHNNKRFIGLN